MLAAGQELAATVGVAAACVALGIPRSSLYAARGSAPPATRFKPPLQPAQVLSPAEQQTIRDLLNSERFVDQAPRTIYATLLDEGQ